MAVPETTMKANSRKSSGSVSPVCEVSAEVVSVGESLPISCWREKEVFEAETGGELIEGGMGGQRTIP